MSTRPCESNSAPATTRILRAIFADAKHFVVHEPLPAADGPGDEGAANHTRFCPSHGARGFHFFVHGDGAATGRAGQIDLSHAARAEAGEEPVGADT